MLKIVAASRNFRIIFDFNRESAMLNVPELDRGNFYSSKIITIGAQELLNDGSRLIALGNLAHELCHCAMVLTYDSFARPYYVNSSQVIHNFERILKMCQNNSEKEEIIKIVFDYPKTMQHAELIARVPQLMVVYHDQPEKITECRENFKQLFEIYEQKVIPEMERTLPAIESAAAQEKEMKNKLIKILVAFGVCVVLGFLLALFLFKI